MSASKKAGHGLDQPRSIKVIGMELHRAIDLRREPRRSQMNHAILILHPDCEPHGDIRPETRLIGLGAAVTCPPLCRKLREGCLGRFPM